MGKYKTLGKNSLYVTVGTFGSKFISFLMLPFYTSWLSVSDFGLTDLLTVYSTLLVSVLTLSLNEAIFVFPVGLSKVKQTFYFSSGFYAILLLAVVGCIIGVTLNVFSDSYGVHNTFLDNIYPIMGLYLASALQGYLQLFCKGIGKMRTFCYAGILYTGMTAAFSFLLIPRYGVFGFIWSNILANMASSVFIFFAEKIYEYLTVRAWNKIIFKQMIGYSIPLIPNTIMWWILSAINRPIIDKYLGLEAMGLFAISSKFPSVLSSISDIFNSSWQVSVLQEYPQKDFSSFFNRVGTLYISALVLLSCLMGIFSPFIVEVATNEKFYDAWKYIPIVTLAVAFTGMAGHAGTIFSASKKSKYFLISSFSGTVTSVVSNLLLIPWLGLYGAAVSFTLSQAVIGVSRMCFANKMIQITNKLSLFILFILNLMIVISVLIGYWVLAYLLVAFTLLYLVFLNRDILSRILIKVRA